MEKTIVRKAVGEECPRLANKQFDWSNQFKIIVDYFANQSTIRRERKDETD